MAERKPMYIKECIRQLESIRDHCRSMVDEQDPEDIWRDDVEALQFAIDTLRSQEKREKNEPKTNADRIRAMSDEELVWLLMGIPEVGCEEMGYPDVCWEYNDECKKCKWDWLQQPAEVGGGTGEAIPDSENMTGGKET